jgi:hypothetical protein
MRTRIKIFVFFFLFYLAVSFIISPSQKDVVRTVLFALVLALLLTVMDKYLKPFVIKVINKVLGPGKV